MTKLTPAEYRLLDALNSVQDGRLNIYMLKPSARTMVKRLKNRGLLSKREFADGIAQMTAAGRRSYSKGQR